MEICYFAGICLISKKNYYSMFYLVSDLMVFAVFGISPKINFLCSFMIMLGVKRLKFSKFEFWVD